MRRAFLDTNVFVYAGGRDHPYRDPCKRVLRLVVQGRLAGETSVAVVQELVHVVRRRSESGEHAVSRGRDAVELVDTLHEVAPADLARALDLLERHPHLLTADALHAAVALERGIEVMLSADRHFDGLRGITRVDPADAAAVAQLAD